MMDLHCGNRWPSGKGEIDVLEYAQHMSLMDSVMFGEGFDDGGTMPCSKLANGTCGNADWMLLATSGLQFGVMNDMLTHISVHRGLVFGMWARPPYSNLDQNHAIWEFIDSSGIAANATEMLGYWSGPQLATNPCHFANVRAHTYAIPLIEVLAITPPCFCEYACSCYAALLTEVPPLLHVILRMCVLMLLPHH